MQKTPDLFAEYAPKKLSRTAERRASLARFIETHGVRFAHVLKQEKPKVWHAVALVPLQKHAHLRTELILSVYWENHAERMTTGKNSLEACRELAKLMGLDGCP